MPAPVDPNAAPDPSNPTDLQQPVAAVADPAVDPGADPPADPAPPTPAADEPTSAADAIRKALNKEPEAPAAAAVPAKPAAEADPPADPNKPAAPAAADPAQDPAAAKAAREAEIARLTDPGDMKGRTRERFEELGESYKKLAGEHQAARDEAQGWRQQAHDWQTVVESTGATPEEFSALLAYTTMVHSNSPDDMKAALEMLDAERAIIAQKLGLDLPGVDPFEGHPDLKQAVDDQDISRERALELARLRNQEREAGQQRQQTQTVEQHAAALDGGQKEVDALMAQLLATEGQALFDAKLAALQPTIEIIARTMPPGQWRSEVSKAYARIRVAVPRAPTPTPAPRTQQRPLIGGGQGDSGAAPQPTSMVDAVRQAIAR